MVWFLIILTIFNTFWLMANIILLAVVGNQVYQIRQFLSSVDNFTKKLKIQMREADIVEVNPSLWNSINYRDNSLSAIADDSVEKLQ